MAGIEIKTSKVHKFGRNNAVTTAWVDISQSGNINFLTTATTIEVIGANANDTAAGTGARAITIEGLDSNYDVAIETIATNGTVASVASTTSFIRVYRAFVSEVGTYGGANFNNITVRVSGGGATLLTISGIEGINTSAYGVGQSETSLFTTPRLTNMTLSKIAASVDGTRTASIVMYQRRAIDNTATNIQSRRVIWSNNAVSGKIVEEFPSEVIIPEKTDIWFRAILSQGTSAISVTYDFSLRNVVEN